MHNILIVDDDKMISSNISLFLNKKGLSADIADSGEKALEIFNKKAYPVVILDYSLPGINGLETLKRIKALDNDTYVIMLTGHGEIDLAVESMKLGASDFLSKPVSGEIIFNVINEAIKFISNNQELQIIKRKQQLQVNNTCIIGKSLCMQKLSELINLIVNSNPRSILVTGENGTGKELVAKAIHKNGTRKDKPFIDINCASIPEDLFESELFGYEKGAFTDANSAKKGFFELANGGTIFFDEIGELSIKLQSKLLRVLEERSYYRVGGQKKIEVDINFIFATNRDLQALIKENKFREDLYYRINIIEVPVAPLRERKDDIKELIEHFMLVYREKYNKNIKNYSRFLQATSTYNFPGNVRELKNLVERGVILSENQELFLESKHQNISETQDSINLVLKPYTIAKGEHTEDFDSKYISTLLAKTKGNISQAANIAGMKVSNLSRLLSKTGIDKNVYKMNLC